MPSSHDAIVVHMVAQQCVDFGLSFAGAGLRSAFVTVAQASGLLWERFPQARELPVFDAKTRGRFLARQEREQPFDLNAHHVCLFRHHIHLPSQDFHFFVSHLPPPEGSDDPSTMLGVVPSGTEGRR